MYVYGTVKNSSDRENMDYYDIKKYTNFNVFAIYDGHRNKKISSLLKKKFVTFLFEDIEDKEDISKTYILKKINEFIIYLNENYYKDMFESGSTLCIVIHVLNKNIIKIINIGDCRVIGCYNNNTYGQLTKDHKPRIYDEFNRITSLGGVVKNTTGTYRIGTLSVSRNIGDNDNKFVSHEPDIFKYNLKDLKFIVMGSDGLFDKLKNGKIINCVLHNQNIKKDIIPELFNYYTSKKIVHDDITAIVVFF